MTTKLTKVLERYEALVESGSIVTFTVLIQQNSILIRPPAPYSEQVVPLIPEMLVLLRAFFFEVESIGYGSFDYASLKGFLHASAGLSEK